MKSILELNSKSVINVTSQEDANILLKIFYDLGLKWCNGDSYLTHNQWGKYRDKTCYNPTSGEYSPLGFYIKYEYTILKVEDLKEFQTTNKTIMTKTTREKLFSIYNTDPCNEFNNVISNILKETFNIPDTQEFDVDRKYTSRVQGECSEKQKQLLKQIGITTSYSNWSRDATNKNGSVHYFLTRLGGGDEAFQVSFGTSTRARLTSVYKSKDVADNEAKLFNLMMLMRNWAIYHNQMDNFVPNWQSGSQQKFGLMLHSGNKLSVISRYGDNEFLFLICLKTEDRARAMLKEFETEIKEIASFL